VDGHYIKISVTYIDSTYQHKNEKYEWANCADGIILCFNVSVGCESLQQLQHLYAEVPPLPSIVVGVKDSEQKGQIFSPGHLFAVSLNTEYVELRLDDKANAEHVFHKIVRRIQRNRSNSSTKSSSSLFLNKKREGKNRESLYSLPETTSLVCLYAAIRSQNVKVAKNLLMSLTREEIDSQEENASTTALMMTIQTKNYPIFRVLVRKGVNLNKVDSLGMSALLLACQKGQFQMVKTLLKRGVDVNLTTSDGKSALHLLVTAEVAGSSRLRKSLSTQSCSSSSTSPHKSHWKNADVLVSVLINCGISVNGLDAYHNTPLHYCIMAQQSNLRIMSALLSLGADPNLFNLYVLIFLQCLT